MSELADHDLIDKYRDPKTGKFSFPGDVAKIIKKLEGDLAKERALCAEIACASIMKFRSRVNGKYYPGYHENMRDFVRTSILGNDGGRKI